LLYQNIADEQLSASEASTVLISQMKAFDIQAENSEHIIDAINETSNQFAVSSGDIGKGLTAAGAALSTYGNSFEQTIALVTAGTEIFQGKSQQVARGLNTISSRIAKNEKALAEYGVAIKDGNGNLRSTYDILADLAPKWETMSNTEQVALGNTLSGVNMYKIFAAVMSNFNTAIEANITALSSQGSATKENEAYMESLQAKVTQLKSAFTEVVLGEGGLNTFLKNLVDAGTGIVKFIGYGNNLVAILTTIGGILVAINAKVIALKIDSIISGIANLATSIKQGLTDSFVTVVKHIVRFSTGVNTATTANEAFTISTQGLVSAIGLVTSAISIGVMAYNKYKQTQEQNAKEARDNLKSYSESTNKYKELEKYLSDTNLSEKELNTILKNNTDIFGEYTDAIKGTTKEREKYLKILKEQNAEEAASTYRESVGEVKEATKRATEGTSLTGFTAKQTSLMKGRTGIDTLPEYYDVTKAKGINAQIEALEKYQDALQKASDEIGEGDLRYSAYQTAIAQTSAEIKKLSDQQEQDKETLENANIAYQIGKENLGAYAQTNEEANKALDKLNGTQNKNAKSADKATESQKTLLKKFGLTAEQAKEFAESLGLTTDEYLKQRNAQSESTDSTDENADSTANNAEAVKDLATQLKELKDVQDTAKDALKEYNKYGGVSYDTLQDLLSLQPEYLQYLINDNGQFEINKTTLGNLNQALANNYTQTLANSAVQDMYNYAMGNTNDMSNLAQSAVGLFGDTAETTGNKATNATGGVLSFATALATANEAAGGKGVNLDKLTEGQEKIMKAYQGYHNQMQKSFKVTAAQTKATKSNSSATSKATKAKKALTEANKKLAKSIEKVSKQLEKEKQKLEDNIDKWKEQAEDIEDVFSVVSDKIQDRIDLLEEEKDARTEQIEAEKEAQNDLLQSQIDAIDAEIEKQEEANDAVNDAIELQEKLEALQKAKATKVKTFKDGEWTYGVDESAVDEAQQALDEYNREKAQENAVSALESQRDILQAQQDSLDKEYEIKLANDGILNSLNNQISILEKQKEQVDTLANKYKDIQNNQLLIQYLGTTDIFGTEGLKNNVIPTLSNVENKYISIQKKIESATKQVEKLEAATKKLDELENKTKSSSKKVSKASVNKKVEKIVASTKTKSKKKKKKKHADGVARVQNDEIALVGDSPDTELVVGSKINEGITTMLPKGSGVVNAKSLNTLAGILNNVGAFSSSNFGAGNGTINNSSQENSTNINISNLNVQTDNGEEFVNYLQDFALKMKQKSY
jgi:TP901 family phage tail tape measure protein